MSDAQPGTNEQQLLDTGYAEWAESEISRARSRDAFTQQMNAILYLYLEWGAEDDRRAARHEHERRVRLDENAAAGRLLLNDYAEREGRINRQLVEKQQGNRSAKRDYESRLRAAGQYIAERRMRANDAFERNLADREARFEKHLQDGEEAFDQELARRNSLPGPI